MTYSAIIHPDTLRPDDPFENGEDIGGLLGSVVVDTAVDATELHQRAAGSRGDVWLT